MSYAVARRTREIGLRLTLGARRGDVLRLILSQALRRLAIGGALGLAGAWLSTRALTTMLYGVQPTDPLTFAAVPAILASPRWRRATCRRAARRASIRWSRCVSTAEPYQLMCDCCADRRRSR